MSDSTNAVLAPIGWGFRAGYVLSGLTAADLPVMPMLRYLTNRDRNAAVLKVLQDCPALARAVRPKDLVAAYGIPHCQASMMLSRTRG